jgi:hypothetical protein
MHPYFVAVGGRFSNNVWAAGEHESNHCLYSCFAIARGRHDYEYQTFRDSIANFIRRLKSVTPSSAPSATTVTESPTPVPPSRSSSSAAITSEAAFRDYISDRVVDMARIDSPQIDNDPAVDANAKKNEIDAALDAYANKVATNQWGGDLEIAIFEAIYGYQVDCIDLSSCQPIRTTNGSVTQRITLGATDIGGKHYDLLAASEDQRIEYSKLSQKDQLYFTTTKTTLFSQMLPYDNEGYIKSFLLSKYQLFMKPSTSWTEVETNLLIPMAKFIESSENKKDARDRVIRHLTSVFFVSLTKTDNMIIDKLDEVQQLDEVRNTMKHVNKKSDNVTEDKWWETFTVRGQEAVNSHMTNQCFASQGYICDACVNGIMRLMIENKSTEERSRMLFADSYVYHTMENANFVERYRNLHFSPFTSKPTVFLPVCFSQHWILAVIKTTPDVRLYIYSRLSAYSFKRTVHSTNRNVHSANGSYRTPCQCEDCARSCTNANGGQLRCVGGSQPRNNTPNADHPRR